MAEPQVAAATLPTRGRIASRGLTSGDITVGDTGVKGSCILIGDHASTVLSLMEHAKLFRPIPSPELVEPLTCINSGTLDKPIYHGRGLLRTVLDRHMWVLTPFLYLPKAKKEWGLRRLGIQETLACLDYLDDWARWLAKSGVDRDFVEKQPAMSCFVAGASHRLETLFIGNEGGSNGCDAPKVVGDESILPSPVAKRSKIEEKMMKAPLLLDLTTISHGSNIAHERR
jgi:hypothetical protein